MIAIDEARRRGFDGEMWAVNPKRSDLAGVPCVASIADLPVVPDAVYLAIPAGDVVEALRSLALIRCWRRSLLLSWVQRSRRCASRKRLS